MQRLDMRKHVRVTTSTSFHTSTRVQLTRTFNLYFRSIGGIFFIYSCCIFPFARTCRPSHYPVAFSVPQLEKWRGVEQIHQSLAAEKLRSSCRPSSSPPSLWSTLKSHPCILGSSPLEFLDYRCIDQLHDPFRLSCSLGIRPTEK